MLKMCLQQVLMPSEWTIQPVAYGLDTLLLDVGSNLTSAIRFMAQGPIKRTSMNYIDVQVNVGSESWTALSGWKYCSKSLESVFGRSDIKSIQTIGWGGGRYAEACIDGNNISFMMLSGDTPGSSQYLKLRGFY